MLDPDQKLLTDTRDLLLPGMRSRYHGNGFEGDLMVSFVDRCLVVMLYSYKTKKTEKHQISLEDIKAGNHKGKLPSIIENLKKRLNVNS